MEDTIIALSTALGEASIHVLRLSGSKSYEIIKKSFLPRNSNRWEANSNFTLHLGKFFSNQQLLDEVLISRMKAPYSYTGEDVIEINCHGGLLVAERILEECMRQGARLADPGEFTKRAFLNGKLDLIQAEAIVDLISAKTDTSANLALNQMSGELTQRIQKLKDHVLETLAFIEAGIDFPEDEVEALDRTGLHNRIQSSLVIAEDLLAGSKTGKILREGMLTVIVGQPNVGKSSLLNALMKEERAIVTDIPGTTRDEIRESVNVGGILLQLVDTAGIRESHDPVEKLGIERSWKALERAELILLIIQAGRDLSEEEIKILKEHSQQVIVLINKIDLLSGGDYLDPLYNEFSNLGVWIPFSVKKKQGFESLESEIRKRVYQGKDDLSREPLLSNIRQISALERSIQALRSANSSLEEGLPWDILSIDIREALQEISQMTGDNVQESLLDDIFSRFCIGK